MPVLAGQEEHRMSEAIESTIDPFHPLLRVINRYRQDVHALQPPPGPEALSRASAHIGRALPIGLERFLARWNGADLFRSALRLRPCRHLAPASAEHRHVILFADGPRSDEHWAFVAHEDGTDLFGRWVANRFEPLHARFERWLFSTVRILDEDIRDPDLQLRARLDADPDGPWLLLREAEHILAGGDPDSARRRLRRAVALEPNLITAWQRLGETLLGDDDSAARWAYLKALRTMRLPAPWPSMSGLDTGLLRTLSRLFPSGDDGWERELRRFQTEGIHDVVTPEELEFVQTAAIGLAKTLIARGDREGARATLESLLERSRGFAIAAPCHQVSLALAEIEADLGHHDAAERRLRVFRDHKDGQQRALAALVLGRIVMMRQEPWAENELTEAVTRLHHPARRA